MEKEEFLKHMRCDRFRNIEYVEPLFGIDKGVGGNDVVHIAFMEEDTRVTVGTYINGRIIRLTVERTGDVFEDRNKAILYLFRNFMRNYGYTELSGVASKEKNNGVK